MALYILRRLVLAIPILFGITVITFGIVHLTPGGFTAMHMEMNPNISPDSMVRLRELYGLDKPWHQQYASWVSRLARLDFGRSFTDQRPVWDKILERLPATLLLSGLSLVVIFLLAIPLGVYAAMHHNRRSDHVITVVTFIGYSIPTFWLALLCMMLFGVILHWLPISGLRSVNHDLLRPGAQILDYAKHLILPVFISAFGGLASISRYTRGNMLEVIRQDYIRMALAKGLSRGQVYYHHALKNALLPVVTILGLSLPGLIGGGFIFETIFSWPGMGRLGYESALSFDYPTIMGIAVIGAVLTLLGNLLADVAYAALDPEDTPVMKSLWLRKLMRKKLAVSGLGIVLLLVIVSLAAPWLVPYDPAWQDLAARLQAPSPHHWLGTDEYGRDLLARMLFGGRISLSVGVVAVGIATLIGIVVGAVAGYFGSWVDQVLMRTVDIVLCIPTLFLILMLIVFVGPNLFNIMLIIGLTGWTELARLVRAEFLTLKQRDYILAARALGIKDQIIIFRHILPNALAPVFVSATFGIAGAILLESGLSFLGLGVQPPVASWGNILSAGKDYLAQAWWLTLFPGLAIFLTVLGYNLLGDGLRDVLDPRLSGGEHG